VATDRDWARAYARQALSDLDAREKLSIDGADKCHRLHFLQMASEKVGKAHLISANGRDKVRRSHAYVEKNLPIIARVFYGKTNAEARMTQWETAQIKKIAAEIELLAPGRSDESTRQDNSEYPWEDAQGRIRVPCEYNFPNVDDSVENKAIVKLIRLIRTAAESYAE
jgi:hypothetical protein